MVCYLRNLIYFGKGMKRELKRNSKIHRLLKNIFLGGGILLISLASPTAGHKIASILLASYFRNRRFEKDRFLRDLKNLQKRELLSFREFENGHVEIKLSARGKEKALFYNIDDLKLDTKKPWDKKWRLVIFDIPHSFKKARDAFREKLKDLHFYQLQRSVFLSPYQCSEEIEFLGAIFKVRHCVLLLEVSRFEGEEKLRHHFGI